jgi:hypothetical protein
MLSGVLSNIYPSGRHGLGDWPRGPMLVGSAVKHLRYGAAKLGGSLKKRTNQGISDCSAMAARPFVGNQRSNALHVLTPFSGRGGKCTPRSWPGTVKTCKKRPSTNFFLEIRQDEKPRKPLMVKVVGGEGFEPSKSKTADLQSAPFGHSGIHPLRSLPCWTRRWARYGGVVGFASWKLKVGQVFTAGGRGGRKVPLRRGASGRWEMGRPPLSGGDGRHPMRFLL